ncbi:MAG TPA: hypothetical protein VLB86_15070 [Gaiellaceae bacterium]|nr:hypothetical protein [Gaiellaceae bacterium]
MSARPAPVPEPDAEREVDFGRWVSAVAARWWLPLLGLVLGIALGWALSLGGKDVYRAQSLVYMGDPLAPSGARVATVGTTVSSIREIVTSEAAVRRAARVSGLTPAQVRGGIFVSQPSGGGGPKAGQPALVNVGVRGDAPRKVALAANDLAKLTVARTGGYVDAKIEGLQGQIAAADEELDSLERRIQASLQAAEAPGLSNEAKLVALTNAGVLEQRRSTVIQARSDRQQLLALAENVEAPRVLQPAVARKVTAQSRRNAIVVAGVLGLLVGLLAALVWDPVAGRLRP